VGFLTAVPVGRRTAIAEDDLRRGLAVFPVVGAFVGGVMALVAWGTALLLPSVPAAVLGVAAGVALTGTLHMDGLADTADGVGAALAGRDPGEAMSDPRLGTFGGAVLVLDLLLKVAVLAALLDGSAFPWTAIAAATIGRMSILGLAWVLPYGGPDAGVGGWTTRLGRRRCLAGLGIGLSIGILTSGARFVPMVAAAIAVVVVVGRWSARHRGGMRGDTYGAAAELSETLALTAGLAAS
jgi:adenosylcobinamide-GDP ribazoletransferase